MNRLPTDFVSDLPMEVLPAFYPPPTFWMPQIEIPPLRKYEYTFEHEKAAIFRWEKERRSERVEEETEQSQQMKKQRQRHMEEKGTKNDGERERTEEGQRRTERRKDNTLNDPEYRNGECFKSESHSVPSPSVLKPNQPPHFASSSLLKPVPMSKSLSNSLHVGIASTQNGNMLQKSTNNNSLDGLEEFEPRRDLFDLLELRSLDARKELEKFFDL
ncbi:hypothetical protein niasHT_001146 [Heterodera trifolii]|uniref:Uncharacterized protein n=1 Tax=Heterodera trifolii TaxID=157864 RepID=A0ABD2LYL3_9BILA